MSKANATAPAAPADAAAQWEPMAMLVPWAENPRVNDHAVDAVAASLIEFGWGRPLIARSANSELIVGHTTLKAANLLPARWASADAKARARWHPDAVVTAERGLVPVRFVDLSERKAHLLALADNRLAEASEWDDASLHDILQGFEPDEMHLAGWSDTEFDGLAPDFTPGDEDQQGQLDEKTMHKCPQCGHEF